MENKLISREQVAERLRRSGINLTHQRLEIAYVLFSRMEHLSADQILTAVNQPHAATSKATVYNTLKLLLDNKLIREVIVDPNRVFFDPNTEPHHHFFDTVTGQLTDIPVDAIEVSSMPPLPPGMVADGVEIIVRTRPAAGS
jgi:Fur family transcriptional regulator, iron response regulator